MVTIRRGLRRSALAVVILAAACGGTPGGDPATVVTSAMSALSTGNLDALRGLACEANQDGMTDGFGIAGQLAQLAPGLDAEGLLAAISIDTSGLTIGTPALEGTNATVPLEGTMKVTIDPEKLKPLLRPILEAQGMPSDEASVDAMLGLMSGMLAGQEIPVDETLRLVQEDGAWKIC